ncbi:hypothetical protein PPACK8108_LOCUS13976 [Phakopsora pachyrhizi]|uniref:Glutamate synthase central-N domain-containing protein n=1 Tax=Phakopsora pachyrhizi TaxID=170000 RepID=A0AAV0B6G8_PHAPC|nr:hypothetical protein PPACK8108_LOCUS13976 [Phakopsora pachyrhizi]
MCLVDMTEGWILDNIELKMLTARKKSGRTTCLAKSNLSVKGFEALQHLRNFKPIWSFKIIDITFEKRAGVPGYSSLLQQICEVASDAVKDHACIIILSDPAVRPELVAVPALAATGAVHHHLIATKECSKVALIVETGKAREVHHLWVLLGYSADGIFPYLEMEVILKIPREGLVKASLSENDLTENYHQATDNGILKVMSKMEILTLQGYKCTQIFEVLGLHKTVVDWCFSGRANRIQGTTFGLLALDAFDYHERGYPSCNTVLPPGLPGSGEYHWNDGSEAHINDLVAMLIFKRLFNPKISLHTIPIVKGPTARSRQLLFEACLNLTTAPFSLSLSKKLSLGLSCALAIAMNRLGGKSNTGEGGKDPSRSQIMPNDEAMRSGIKLVASGQFGVTSNYLSDSANVSNQLLMLFISVLNSSLPIFNYSIIVQIKMAQSLKRVMMVAQEHPGGLGSNMQDYPWELGLAETHQTIVHNNLRGRVCLQTNGQSELAVMWP